MSALGYPVARYFVIPAFIGCVLNLNATFLYYVFGFDWAIFFLWLSGLALIALTFYRISPPAFPQVGRLDVLIWLALLAVSLPIYFWSIYNIPFQINTDECVHMMFEQDWLRQGKNDLFGISSYFGFPYFPFLILGWLGNLIGGINLCHQRMLQAGVAVLIVLTCYVFYRTLGLNKLVSTTGALSVCFNHVLILYSRRAMRDNPAVLAEVTTLTLLYAGIRFRSLFLTYCGGIFGGICCYQYYPARITIPIWLVFLSIAFLINKADFPRKEVLKYALVFTSSFILCVCPIVAANLREPGYSADAINYQQSVCLLYPQGRRTTKLFNASSSEVEAITRNIISGLTVFNNFVRDRGHSAHNEEKNNCFLDPLSGLLLWVGFFHLLRRFKEDRAISLMVSGVMLQLFFYSFIVGQAPDYFRLLVTLPFVGYFVAHGIETVTSYLASRAPRVWGPISAFHFRRQLLFAFLLSLILGWNSVIVWAYVADGLNQGDEIGSTVRYIEARKKDQHHCFFIVGNDKFRYFSWAHHNDWSCWMKPFLNGGQSLEFLSARDLTTVKLSPPFTIFTNGDLWRLAAAQLKILYPQLIVHKLADERDLIAIEVRPSSSAIGSGTDKSHYLTEIETAINDGNSQAAINLCDKALEAYPHSNKGSDYKSRILYEQGLALLNLGEYRRAVPNLAQALLLQCEISGTAVAESARYASALGDAYRGIGDWAEALKSYQYSLKIAQNAREEEYFELEPQEIVDGYANTAKALWMQGQFSESERMLRKAKRSTEKQADWPTPKEKMILELIHYEIFRQRLKSASDLCEQLISMQKTEGKHFAFSDEVPKIYKELGELYAAKGDLTSACKAFATAANLAPTAKEKSDYLRSLNAAKKNLQLKTRR
jgi:tetratricopeptide (TPR) repeat protein/uncharacterized membrane protein YozB (DUF420 family)